jgi:hypothetical protein
MTDLARLENGQNPDFDRVQEHLDVNRAILTRNPILNPGFETWSGSTSFTNPADGATTVDNWGYAKSGTSAPSANVSRESTIIDTETYSLKINITSGGSSNSLIEIAQVIANPSRYAGKTVVFGAKVLCSTASKVRLAIYEGGTDVDEVSSHHSGGGEWENLQAVMTFAEDTEIAAYFEITSDFTGAIYFDSCYLYEINPYMSATARAALTFDKNQSFFIFQGTNWVSFTPTGSWSTNTTYAGKYRRVGDSIEVEATISLAGAPTAATLTVNLPSGLTMDTGKISGPGSESILGSAMAVDASPFTLIPGIVLYNSTSSVAIRSHAESGTAVTLAVVNATAPVTFASGDKVMLKFSAPISGWDVAG